jgi:hypothetical protein
MNTLEVAKKFPIGNLDHLFGELEIPVLTGAQAQGDVSWFPTPKGEVAGLKEIPAKGIVIVEGQNGHPHVLFNYEGTCLFKPDTQRGSGIGTVVVPEGAVLGVAHNEHGYNMVGTGTYVFNRAREMADGIRLVAD